MEAIKRHKLACWLVALVISSAVWLLLIEYLGEGYFLALAIPMVLLAPWGKPRSNLYGQIYYCLVVSYLLCLLIWSLVIR